MMAIQQTEELAAIRTAPSPTPRKQSKPKLGNIDKGNHATKNSSGLSIRSLIGFFLALIVIIWTGSVSKDLSFYLSSVSHQSSTQFVQSSKSIISSGKKEAKVIDSDSANFDAAYDSRRHDDEGAYSENDDDGDRNFSLVDAYSRCCMGDNDFNCTESDTNWFVRLLQKSPLVRQGKSTLYWAHMRKAGGTSFGNNIESAVSSLSIKNKFRLLDDISLI